ncbi:DODA-type extradiol aromatic ring-opening family dioxygenase [Psychrobacter sp. FDAARGOS_221]|uniref:DODA-type extradiol aromatic ring-opening family dioxygenase n=1 Tax=Psychrobacter sp. FDAARGOS_221 TaxID=1975705 RepID=UPI001D0D585A|nr:class III extradiol ring-cleavage dioxygenase [Psychrobacter sp. FDAARGOS_221]
MQALATLPALFISHGAPSFALEKNTTTNALARTGQNLPRPKAIVIMSAHWVTQTLEIASNPAPQTWHDFSGFSPQLNRLEYPANGHPELAEWLSIQLNKMGINNSLNPLRPLDHGVWVPLLHLYPEADVPIVQLSLPKHYDAYACYQLGALFEQLRQEQILVIGSGSITHNLAALHWDASSEDAQAKAFKLWLLNKLKTDIPAALEWQDFDNVEKVHPTAEHLLPLFFALGCGQRVSVIHESMAHHSLGMDIYRFD